MGCCVGKKVLPDSTNRSGSTSRRVRHQAASKTRQVKGNTSLLDQKYTIFSTIGEGEFGQVVRAEHKQTKIPYAIKIIDLTQDILASSRLEVKILHTVKHKYVIRLYEVLQTSRRMYLVMDLATGGELMDRICLLGNFSECHAAHVLFMILDGLRYLHSLGITHRDLKPQNVLFYHPGADSKIIITDFGLSTMREGSRGTAKHWMKTDCGTIEYMAPEVITRALYTNAVDMWSMGVIAYIVLSGRLPFPVNGNVMSTLRAICFCKYNFEGEPWDDISDEAKDFISSLLVFEPSKRLTAEAALEHKWIKNKHHNERNLQRSISSNWGDSCVSLKNEKAERHARTRDSTNPCKCTGNSAKKSTYGAIDKSKDDGKGSHGKTKTYEDHKALQKNASDAAAREYFDICDSTFKNCCESCDIASRGDEGKPSTCIKKHCTEEKMKQRLRTNAKDSTRKERKPNSTNVKRIPSKQYRSKVGPVMVKNPEKPTAQDFNGNEGSVKPVVPSSNDVGYLTDRSHVNKKATLLPPIKSSRLVMGDNTVK